MTALDEQERFINFLDLRAVIATAEGSMVQSTLDQVAPGEYLMDFEAGKSGAYMITLYGQRGESSIPPETHGLIVPYAQEYREFEPNLSLLQQLAELTGGQLLSTDDKDPFEVVFLRAESGISAAVEIAPWLLLAALLLLVFEIAVRRIIIPRAWLYHLKALPAFLFNKSRTLQPAGDGTIEPSYEELSRLIEQRHRERREERARQSIEFWFGRVKNH